MKTSKVNNSTLEQIENDYWPEPEYDSYVVATCHSLRKKPLDRFTDEDLRIMIGQNRSPAILIPLAIDRLRAAKGVEDDDDIENLLYNVLRSDAEFWLQHKDLWQALILVHKEHFEPHVGDKRIVKAYRRFKELFV